MGTNVSQVERTISTSGVAGGFAISTLAADLPWAAEWRQTLKVWAPPRTIDVSVGRPPVRLACEVPVTDEYIKVQRAGVRFHGAQSRL